MRRVAALLALVLLAVPGAIPAAATAVPTCFELPATIFGKSGTISGTPGNDVIVGSEGPDRINAGGGDDMVCGLGGDDTIIGGDGVDFLVGGLGDDTLSGGDGNDLVNGGDEMADCPGSEAGEDDRLDGGAGDDVLFDQCGANRATGGSGRDRGVVTGTFDAGSGDDDLESAPLPTSQPLSVTITITPPVNVQESCDGCGDGRALGGSGSDSILVRGGVADGGSGNDTVQGGLVGDVVLGGSGSDTLQNSTGVEDMQLDGGAGRDTCNSNGATNNTVRRCEVVL